MMLTSSKGTSRQAKALDRGMVSVGAGYAVAVGRRLGHGTYRQ